MGQKAETTRPRKDEVVQAPGSASRQVVKSLDVKDTGRASGGLCFTHQTAQKNPGGPKC